MARKNPFFAEVHIRLEHADWRELQLWCASGIQTVSASNIVQTLLKHFLDETVRTTPSMDLEALVNGIQTAVRTGSQTIKVRRAGQESV